MIVFGVWFLLALAAAAGGAVVAPDHQIKGIFASLTIGSILVSGIVLAVNSL